MVYLLPLGSLSSDAAPVRSRAQVVLPPLQQDTLYPAQPAATPLLQALQFFFRNSCARADGGHKVFTSSRKQICELDLSANFIECSVAAGGSSALLAAVIARHIRRPRKLFSFDTFDGLPVTTEFDTHQGRPAEAMEWGAGTCSAPEASLREACDKLGVTAFIEPVKGLISESLRACRERVGPIAFLHMDGDWHASTTDIFENRFDHVAPGARIQIDDYRYRVTAGVRSQTLRKSAD